MLYPSIDKLMQKLDSKYTLVTVASKRARNLRDFGNPQIEKPVSQKYVGVSLEEILEDKIEYHVPYLQEEKNA